MNLTFLWRAGMGYCRYHLGMPRPVSAHFRLTYRCNLNCGFCNVRKRESQEMSASDVRSCLRKMDSMGIAYLTLSGGEPLMREDFTEIAQGIRKTGLKASLNTNGTLITPQLARIISKTFTNVRVSIDGDESAHDARRGKGTYGQAIRGITLLRKERCIVYAHFTVGSDNEKIIPDAIQRISPLVDKISLMPLVSFRNGKKFSYRPRTPLLHHVQPEKRNQMGSVHDPSRERVNRSDCDAGILYFHLLPSGEVTPCPELFEPYAIGNLNISAPSDILGHRTTHPECRGCANRCTKEISSLIRMNPKRLLNNARRIVSRYGI